MYSTHNEGKFVVAERFIRTLKIKIYKYMTSVSKNVYIDKLDDIANKYNNTYNSTMKMKPVDIKSNPYIDSGKEINEKDPKFKIGDTVRISKYKKFFAKGNTPNWYKEVSVFRKFKNIVPWRYFINDLNGEKIVMELQKANQKQFRTEKIIKRKANKPFVKWKRYINSFNSWIDKKDIV